MIVCFNFPFRLVWRVYSESLNLICRFYPISWVDNWPYAPLSPKPEVQKRKLKGFKKEKKRRNTKKKKRKHPRRNEIARNRTWLWVATWTSSILPFHLNGYVDLRAFGSDPLTHTTYKRATSVNLDGTTWHGFPNSIESRTVAGC